MAVVKKSHVFQTLAVRNGREKTQRSIRPQFRHEGIFWKLRPISLGCGHRLLPLRQLISTRNYTSVYSLEIAT